MADRPPLTAERLREVLRYDPDMGEWTRLERTSQNMRVGDKAGCIGSNGYRYIGIEGRRYLSSRLAVLYMTGSWPEREVDHRDTDPGNDRWLNLRPATRSQNNGNQRLSARNTSGFKGVHWSAKERKWIASICRKRLGCFDTPDAAAAARHAAARAHFGEFARF